MTASLRFGGWAGLLALFIVAPASARELRVRQNGAGCFSALSWSLRERR